MCNRITQRPISKKYIKCLTFFLISQLLTPFRIVGALTQQQWNYNHRLSSARVVVERAFGLLKGKWRRLKFLTAHKLEYAVKTVVACAVLHNHILLEGDGLPLVSVVNASLPYLSKEVAKSLQKLVYIDLYQSIFF